MLTRLRKRFKKPATPLDALLAVLNTYDRDQHQGLQTEYSRYEASGVSATEHLLVSRLKTAIAESNLTRNVDVKLIEIVRLFDYWDICLYQEDYGYIYSYPLSWTFEPLIIALESTIPNPESTWPLRH